MEICQSVEHLFQATYGIGLSEYAFTMGKQGDIFGSLLLESMATLRSDLTTTPLCLTFLDAPGLLVDTIKEACGAVPNATWLEIPGYKGTHMLVFSNHIVLRTLLDILPRK